MNTLRLPCPRANDTDRATRRQRCSGWAATTLRSFPSRNRVNALYVRTAIVAIVGIAAIGTTHSTTRGEESAQTTRSVWDGVYTTEQEKRGAEQYTRVCAHCHGEDLAGTDEAAPLSGPAFLANWDGLTLGDLAERIIRTMPENDPGHLTRRQVADIITHVLSFNGFPAGKQELDPRVEMLRQIRIEASKPAPQFDSESNGKQLRAPAQADCYEKEGQC